MKGNDNQEYPVQKLPVSSLVPFKNHPFKVARFVNYSTEMM